VVRTLSSYETSLCSLPARVPVLERDLHGGFHGFGTARGVDDRLEVRSALRQQQMGQLFERLAAEKISVSACDLRADSRSSRSPRVVVADAERGRSAGAIRVPTTRRVVQIASLAAGNSWERIESPAEGAPCAYGGWGWRADGG
jgi:hypothetical protein